MNATTKFFPAVSVEAKSTAGAGDAFLAGTLCGICCGLDAFDATAFGVVVAADSVTSPDTINHAINADQIYHFTREKVPGNEALFMKIFNLP